MNLDNINWKNSEQVTINNVETSALMEDSSDTLTFYADKYIITKYPIKTGDIVEYEDLKYLIISQIDRNKDNYRARIRQCDFNIKFNFKGEIKEFSTTIDGGNFDINTGQYVSLAIGKILVTISNIIDINIGQRFIKIGSAWKVTGIDKSRKGLIILHCDIDQFGIDDDRESEIADRWKYEVEEPIEPEPPVDTFTYEIQGSSTLQLNQTLTYSVIKKNNGEVVDSEFTFSIDYLGNATSIVSIVEETSNTIKLKGSSNSSHIGKYFKLIATDVETEDVVEKDIIIRSLF